MALRLNGVVTVPFFILMPIGPGALPMGTAHFSIAITLLHLSDQ